MPRYVYKAFSPKGQKEEGMAFADNKYQLADILKGKGLLLIKASLAEEREKKRGFSLFDKKPSLSEKMFFTRNLEMMVSAGLSLPRAIHTLALQMKNERFKRALFDVEGRITKGENFSDSLAQHRDIFSELFISMVRAGEESGTLEKSLSVLSNQLEREQRLKSQIMGALLYPSVIVIAMIGIGILMLFVVVPKLSATFKDLGVQLPLMTRIVIGSATFLVQKWYLTILALFLSIFLLLKFLKSQKGKNVLDSLTLRIPIIANVVKDLNSAYLARTLGSLLASGIALPRALEITSKILSNSFYVNALQKAAKKIRKGEKLSQTLSPYNKILPLTLLQMVAVGEETGETASILTKLAQFYEESVKRATDNLASVLEPILILFIGTVVGFFAIAMVKPLYSMLGAVQ